MSQSAEAKLRELEIELPPAPKAAGLYRLAVVSGNLCCVSGHISMNSSGDLITGRVGDELDQAAGYEAARQAGLAILATLRQSLGSLDRVSRVIRLFGMVNATSDFCQHPAVINGASELFAQVWGPEAGVGVRCAMGAASLPLNVAVEVEATFELDHGSAND